MNVEQRQAAVDPQTKPPDLGCESHCIGCYRLQAWSPFIIVIYSLYILWNRANNYAHKTNMTSLATDDSIYPCRVASSNSKQKDPPRIDICSNKTVVRIGNSELTSLIDKKCVFYLRITILDIRTRATPKSSSISCSESCPSIHPQIPFKTLGHIKEIE